MAYKIRISSLIAVCMVFFAGCTNSLTEPERRGPNPRGTVLIRLSQDRQERTLYPDRELITGYTLRFVSDKGETHPEQSITEGETLPVELGTGTWTISATGYTAGKVPAVQGSTQVTVDGAAAVTAEIQMGAIVTEAGKNGTFEYTVEFPSGAVETAVLLLSSMDEEGTCVLYTSVDLLAGGGGGVCSGSLTLSAGYYRMDIQLTGAQSAAGKTEVVHIYPGLITKTPAYRYGEEDFQTVPAFDGAAALKAYLDGLPENTPDQPYPVKAGGIDLSMSSKVKTLYEALSRYVSLDLDGCTGERMANSTQANKKYIVSVILPETVTIVGLKAFEGCADLVSARLPGVRTIEYGAFKSCGKLEWVNAPRLIEITNSDGASNSGAFYNCAALTSITLDEVTSIAERSFYKCGALRSLSIPKVTAIGAHAFKECGELSSVSLPRAASIGESAFEDCKNLASVTLGAAPPELGGSKVFFKTAGGLEITVPAAALNAYQASVLEYWDALKGKLKGC